jgi:hypothetical protein
MGSIRVLINPVFGGHEPQDPAAFYGRLEFSTFGDGASQLGAGEKKPAELVFSLAFLTHARGVSGGDFSELARLRGEIERDGRDQVVFTLPGDWVCERTATEAEDDPARCLALGFGANSFRNLSQERLAKLRLPRAPVGSQYFELGVELLIGGATEAAREVNDILDAPLRLVPQDLSDRLRVVVGLPYEDFRLTKRRYKLTVDGEEFVGVISESGEIVLPKKVTSGTGILEVQPFVGSQRIYRWTLDIGSLEDLDTVEGVQSRLLNQGFAAGPVDGDAGPKTASAVRAFQHRHGLLADGSISDETTQKLHEVYGC